jgi:hypothetical protein
MKNKYSMMALTFLIGVIVGGGIIWLTLCCCCKKHCERNSECCHNTIINTDPKQIDVPTANLYYHNYMKHPLSVDSLRAFTITLEQYQAMNLILKAEPVNSVHGFRFYLGNKKIGDEPVIMVVGTGSPDKTGSIFSTPAAGSGPCPYVCDHGSPITK